MASDIPSIMPKTIAPRSLICITKDSQPTDASLALLLAGSFAQPMESWHDLPHLTTLPATLA